jgi:MFS family permease
MSAAPLPVFTQPVNDLTHLRTTLFIEAILSFACSFLFIGVFFYTAKVFGWHLLQNFLLASAQGLVYMISALFSQRVARAVGRRRLLILSHITLAGITLAGVLISSHAVLTGVIIAYVPLIAINWPIIESAVAANADPHALSRRIGLYNLIWAATGAIGLAAQGTLVRVDVRAVFFIPMVIHIVITAIVLTRRDFGNWADDKTRESDAPSPRAGYAPGDNPDSSLPAHAPPHAHLEPEPALLAQRTQALWLSRIALPSTYVVIYSLSALMPLLPVVKSLDSATQTLVGSTWLASRWLTFWFLGMTVFWHTRPRLLLAAALLMAASFIVVTAPIGLLGMIAAQLLLGIAVGVIYTASLYFGMVLSEGSTEHAGYHEALIGLGQILGPGVGALTQWRWPNSLGAGVVAVSSLIGLTLIAATVAAMKGRRRG